MLYKTEWHEAGNRLHKTGHISRVKIPLHIWALNWLLEKHPHWDWLHSLSKNWGNPLCAAYCYSWSNWYWKQEIQELNISVGYDKLSQSYRDWYAEEMKDIG